MRQLRQELQEVYGARLKAVYLFGSHARGEAREDSDIDVAVVLNTFTSAYTERMQCSELQAQLSLENDCVLTLVFLKVAAFERGDYALHRAVAREGIEV